MEEKGSLAKDNIMTGVNSKLAACGGRPYKRSGWE